MKRSLVLLYGALCYVVFLAAFLDAIWFLWRLDGRPQKLPWPGALLIDAGLLALFALQHSGMARQSFKPVWTRVIPREAERSTYVLVASFVLLAVIQYWQPLPGIVWNVQRAPAVLALHAMFAFGWLTVLVCTFLIDHFDLAGLKQVWRYFRALPYEPPAFRTPGPYRLVRHPLYLGFLIAFWSAPVMSSSHLFFSVMCTAYIILAIHFEERDLVSYHGEQYKLYRSGVSMIVPWPAKKKERETVAR